MAVYINLNINIGDVHLQQNYIWLHFEKFMSLYQLLPED